MDRKEKNDIIHKMIKTVTRRHNQNEDEIVKEIGNRLLDELTKSRATFKAMQGRFDKITDDISCCCITDHENHKGGSWAVDFYFWLCDRIDAGDIDLNKVIDKQNKPL